MTRPNLEILGYEDTDLGPLCLRSRELLSAPGTIVTDWFDRGLVPLSSELEQDHRFSAIQGHAYALPSAAPSKRYDLILIDIDHAPAPVTVFNDMVNEERTDWLFCVRQDEPRE